MKKLIILRGPSGVGKSTVIKELLLHFGKNVAYIPVAHTTYSLIPEEIEFASDNLINLMHDNADDLVRNFLKANYTVLTDAIFYHKTNNKSRLDRLVKIGQRNNAKIYVFDLEASLPTLLSRAKKRARPKDVSTDFALIKKKYITFSRNRYKNAIAVSTDNKSVKKIVEEILSYV
ncbi:MAG: AAA family ATPase [Candidatus Woesearchaeota archaeon]